jgi:hypothetical protein
MVECELKVLCYNCDEKYFLGHKCKEYKFLMAIAKDIEASPMEEIPPTYDTTPLTDPPEGEH